MSLFSGLGLIEPPSKPFENVAFENGKAICQSHQEDLNLLYLSKGLFAKKSNFAACSKCEKPAEMTSSCLAAFRAYPKSQCCVVSPFLSQDSSERAPTMKNPGLDFENHVTEYVLWDMGSDGYDLKSLVYMKDQGILAACSKNGSISFWSLGEKVELMEPKLNLQRTINFAKYCRTSDGKKYLAVGTDKGVHIYHVTGDISSIQLLGVIDEEKIVSDLDFLEEERKIVTVYDESLAKIWSLETLEMEKLIDLHQYEIKGKLHTVMYLKRTGELAIEHEKGLSIIRNWQYKSNSVRHHLVDEKTSFGCKYLPNSGVFIMSNGSFVETLREEDFALVEKNILPEILLGNESIPKKFLASQDESVIITNGALSQLQSFKKQKLQKYHLNNFVFGMSDLELIEDQYRIAVAHPHKGTVTIFRVNASMNIERSKGRLPAISSTEKNFHQSLTGLFPENTSNSGNRNKGSLFKGGGTGGSLFSGIAQGGSLFSGKFSSGNLSSGDGSGGSLFSAASAGVNLFSRNSNSNLRKPSSRVDTNNTSLSSGKSSKNSTSDKLKQASKQNKNITEAVGIEGKKKTKEEKAWVVLPTAADDDGNKRGRNLKKTHRAQENESCKEGKRKVDLSQDKGSRSRSKSKSITRKK